MAKKWDKSQNQPVGCNGEISFLNVQLRTVNGLCIIRTDNNTLHENKLVVHLNFFEPVFFTTVRSINLGKSITKEM